MDKEQIKEVIKALMKEAHETAKSKGWWNERRTFAEIVALIHSELSEALEEYRKFWFLDYQKLDDKPLGVTSELADVLIRIFDIAEKENLPLARILIEKMEYNKTRSYRHGGKKI